MLGNRTEVEVYGMISEKGVSKGYIKSKNAKFKSENPVYVISDRLLEGAVNCIIVALGYSDDHKDPILIAAPERESIFYECELKEKLASVRNLSFSSIQCLYEKSCGGLVFCKKSGKTRLLLVKNKNGKYWSFPKGHVEKGENERQTALREIKEETGLSVKLIDGFREVSDYSPFGKIRKRVVFFLAEASTERVCIQPDEIDYYVWTDIDKAKEMCIYKNDLRVIDRAKSTILNLK